MYFTFTYKTGWKYCRKWVFDTEDFVRNCTRTYLYKYRGPFAFWRRIRKQYVIIIMIFILYIQHLFMILHFLNINFFWKHIILAGVLSDVITYVKSQTVRAFVNILKVTAVAQNPGVIHNLEVIGELKAGDTVKFMKKGKGFFPTPYYICHFPMLYMSYFIIFFN